MSARQWVVLAAAVVGGVSVLGACGSFGSTGDGEAAGEGGLEAAPTSTDGSTDGATSADAAEGGKDAGDAGAASDASDGALTCPGVDLLTDHNNCGACGRMCNSPTCVAGECEHLVFLTQTAMPGNLGGLAAADAYCTTVAVSSGSSHANVPFKAWLSTGATDVAARFTHGNRRYFDKQAKTIAADWTALVSGTLELGIRWTEFGSSIVGAPVRTGTTPPGVFVGPMDCADWTSSSAAVTNTFGLSGAADGTWTQGAAAQTCQLSSHLYCIEQ